MGFSLRWVLRQRKGCGRADCAYARVMPRRRIRVTGTPEAPLRAALTALRTELGVPETFPPEVDRKSVV